MTVEEVVKEMSRSFEWSNFLILCAQALATFRTELREGNIMFATSAQTTMGLGDEWPLAIEDAKSVQEWLARVAPRTTLATPAGFLAMMTIALRQPWAKPEGPLPEPARSSRIMRLAMICSDLAEPGLRTGLFKTTRILLDIFRTQSFDRSEPRLVRAYKMYAEDLCQEHPELSAEFEAQVGMLVGDWIVGLCALHSMLEHRVVIDLSGNECVRFQQPIQAIRRLAAPPSWYKVALDRDELDVVSVFHKNPIVDFGGEKYLVVQREFLLSAADEGVVSKLKGSLGRLGNPHGDAFQAYARDVLRRCFGTENVAEVRTAGGRERQSGNLRCDFAIVTGNDLLLIDAKQLLLGDRCLDGIDGVECLLPQLRKGLRQILDTADAFFRGEARKVAPDLSVSEDWRPRRYFGWLVIQPDLPVWYEDRRNLIKEEVTISDRWDSRMSGLPQVLPIACLEHLEAAGLSCIQKFLEFTDQNSPVASGGVRGFLSYVGYRGNVYSDVLAEQFREICRRVGLFE